MELIKTSYSAKYNDLNALYDKSVNQLQEARAKIDELIKLNADDVAELTAVIDELREAADDAPAEILLVDLDNATLGELLTAAWSKIWNKIKNIK